MTNKEIDRMRLSKLLAIASLLFALGISPVSASEMAHQTKRVEAKPTKSVKQKAADTSTKNETQMQYGVKGARLRPTQVSNKTYRYQVKGKGYQTIDKEHSRQYSQVGVASYYGGAFNGRKTSSGESFDETRYTAAHKTLALGSYALVTNLRNNRKVIVRINDRGPFSQARIIDLSKGAARELGMINSGTATVKVEAMLVDKQGYLSGTGAKTLYQLAKRKGLPIKIKNKSGELVFKADDRRKVIKDEQTEKVDQKS